MNRKFVLVTDTKDSMFCEGIYDDYFTAFGHVMDSIYEMKESYTASGDEFEISDPYELEGSGGISVKVTYKARTWENADEEQACLLLNLLRLLELRGENSEGKTF